ncbi:MAG: hypothetical protein M1582_03320 [Actinobacteria bacterium]|nr:hypothetical protein [Actinomycetota bacterium]
MAKYMIYAPHTPEQCLQSLDSLMADGNLDKFYFGCKHGDHSGYALVDAPNDAAALNMVPSFLRSRTQVSEVAKVTPNELTAMHTKAA